MGTTPAPLLETYRYRYLECFQTIQELKAQFEHKLQVVHPVHAPGGTPKKGLIGNSRGGPHRGGVHKIRILIRDLL